MGVSDPHYIEADTLGSCFKVTFRDARYLLTVLRPVG